MRFSARAAAGLAAAALALAGGAPVLAQPPAPLAAAFVAIGPDGAAVARAITRAATCPALDLDGKPVPMAVRAEPGTEPLRPTKSSPENSKPSAFPLLVCELSLPSGTRSAQLNGRALPLPKAAARRVLVIGDTGCRLKASDDAWQACDDPAAFPFARIAAKAAALRPDLVIHVGDYLYRENPCPAGNAGCAGSPWGYGWDAWDADFFTPGAPLLAAAPWVLVRGNHENCARAGQGWWRLLDPRPLVAGRDCNDPANDVQGDYSPPYAVPLGRQAQVVVMDLSAAGTAPLKPGDPRIAQFTQTWQALAGFAGQARFTFAADHYPVLGIAGREKAGEPELFFGNAALLGVFGAQDPAILPDGVDSLLAGHIHLWQQLDFGGRLPSQFVAGFSGTQEDNPVLPDRLAPEQTPVPGIPVRQFSSIIGKFGYMLLERKGTTSWRATVFGIAGGVLETCKLKGRSARCRPR